MLTIYSEEPTVVSELCSVSLPSRTWSHGIAVVNNSKCGARLSLRQKHKIAHVFLKCDDRAEAAQDLAGFFETAVEFIKRALKAREAILVHCGQGVSRSASIVIAYAHRTNPSAPLLY